MTAHDPEGTTPGEPGGPPPEDPARRNNLHRSHRPPGEPGGPPPEDPAGAIYEGQGFLRRLVGALQLERATYDDIARDPGATGQAAIVVGLSALAQAQGGPAPAGLAQLPGILAWGYFSWLLPGTLLWILARKVLSLEADLIRVLRCIGFATVPQILWLIGLLAPDSVPFQLALGVSIFGLGIATNVLAIRQGFATSTIRAIQTLLAFAAAALLVGALLVAILPQP